MPLPAWANSPACQAERPEQHTHTEPVHPAPPRPVPSCPPLPQAEARRRSRINERLEALRQLVPHTERANTANFLEEVVGYVQRLQARVVELERQLGLPPSVQASGKPISFSGGRGGAGRGCLGWSRQIVGACGSGPKSHAVPCPVVLCCAVLCHAFRQGALLHSQPPSLFSCTGAGSTAAALH